MHHHRDGVSGSSLVCVIEEPEAVWSRTLSAVVNSEWWLSRGNPAVLFLAGPLVYKNLSAVNGPRLIPLPFVCKWLSLFVFSDFLVVLRLDLVSGPRFGGSHFQRLGGAQLGFITRILPRPFTSNKHTGDVKQNKVRRKAVNNSKLLFFICIRWLFGFFLTDFLTLVPMRNIVFCSLKAL